MYLVTQEPEDHHSGQVPLQALCFLCWGPACPAEKVSKPFAFLRWGICVNVNLYLTNGILSHRMYQYLMIYYKCFHQVINVAPWQKARVPGGSRAVGKAGPVALCVCVCVFPCGPSPMQVVTAHLPPDPTPMLGTVAKWLVPARWRSEQQSFLPGPSVPNQTLSPSASCRANFVSHWFYSCMYFVVIRSPT